MIVVSFALIIFLLPSGLVNASMFDRIKDIYQMPDRVEELQELYTESVQQLEGQLEAQRQQFEGQLDAQMQQLEQSRRQTEDLLKQQEVLKRNNDHYLQDNEQYKQQNEALTEQNQQLAKRMEKMEDDRKMLIRKIILTVSVFVVLFLAYALSVRIWRYIVWRKQGGDHQRAMLP